MPVEMPVSSCAAMSPRLVAGQKVEMGLLAHASPRALQMGAPLMAPGSSTAEEMVRLMDQGCTARLARGREAQGAAASKEGAAVEECIAAITVLSDGVTKEDIFMLLRTCPCAEYFGRDTSVNRERGYITDDFLSDSCETEDEGGADDGSNGGAGGARNERVAAPQDSGDEGDGAASEDQVPIELLLTTRQRPAVPIHHEKLIVKSFKSAIPASRRKKPNAWRKPKSSSVVFGRVRQGRPPVPTCVRHLQCHVPWWQPSVARLTWVQHSQGRGLSWLGLTGDAAAN